MGIDYYNCSGCNEIINDYSDNYESCLTVYTESGKILEPPFCSNCANKYKSRSIPSGLVSIIVKNEYKVPEYKEFESIFPRDVYNIIVKYLEYGFHFFNAIDRKEYIKLQQLMYRSNKCSCIFIDDDIEKFDDEFIIGGNIEMILSGYTTATKLNKIRALDLSTMAKTIRPSRLSQMDSDDDEGDESDADNVENVKADTKIKVEDDDNDVDDDDRSEKVKLKQVDKSKLLEQVWNTILSHKLNDEDDSAFAKMLDVDKFMCHLNGALRHPKNLDDMEYEQVYFEIPHHIGEKFERLESQIDAMENKLFCLKERVKDIKQGNDYKFAQWNVSDKKTVIVILFGEQRVVDKESRFVDDVNINNTPNKKSQNKKRKCEDDSDNDNELNNSGSLTTKKRKS